MAVIPQYQGDPNSQVRDVAAFDSGVSLMEKAQRGVQQGEQARRDQLARDEAAPLVQAKRQADLLTTQAGLESFKRAQDLRAQVATAIGPMSDKFIAIQKMPDLQARGDALASLQAEASWMENAPEGKILVDAINTSRVRTDDHFLKDQTLKGMLAKAKMDNETRLTQATANNTTKNYAVDQNNATKVDVAATRAESSVATQAERNAGQISNTQEKAKGAMSSEAMHDTNAFTRMAEAKIKEATLAFNNGDKATGVRLLGEAADIGKRAMERLTRDDPKPIIVPSTAQDRSYQSAVKVLQANKDNPKIVADFEAKYKVSAKSILPQ